MLVSIIVLVYNRPKLTRQTLTTLRQTLQLTDVPFEVIVVDNASELATQELLKEFPDFQHIRIDDNKGVGGGKNIGVVAAKGTHLYITDNDMYFLAGWLDELVATHRAFPEAKLIGGYRHQLHPLYQTLEKDGLRYQHTQQLAGNSWFLSRKTWNAYGPLLEGVKTGIDDVVFCNAVMKDGYMVGSILPHRVIHCGVYTSSGTLTPEAQQLWSTEELSISVLPPGILFG